MNMSISQKREAGAILETSGVIQRIINLAGEITTGDLEGVIDKGARIAELLEAIPDKPIQNLVKAGREGEQCIFTQLINGDLMRAAVVGHAVPATSFAQIWVNVTKECNRKRHG